MLLKTFLTPQTVPLPRICTGGRGFFLGGGAFPILPCPEVEGVVFVQKRCPNFPMEFQSFIGAGVARASAEGIRTGNRLCSLRMEPDLLKYHDIDTNEQGAERRTFLFVRDLWSRADPIEPLPLAWKTTEVLAVARGYLDGGDQHLPILADALEEAGCDRPLILTHLRTCADHGPRCWVMDLLLEGGKDRPNSSDQSDAAAGRS
jgi:hypothetical protein